MPSINLSDAKTFVANWRSVNQEATINGHPANQLFPTAYSVSLADIQQLMDTPNLGGIRIYFGYADNNPGPDPSGTAFPMKIMLVGIDSHGKDIVHTSGPSGIYDYCTPCPQSCDHSSPLI